MFVAVCISLTGLLSVAQAKGNDCEQVAQILGRIVVPNFPLKDFSITDFGAIGDGHRDGTAAIQAAIDACHDAGGGRVLVPCGVFVAGAIHLKSNVNLHLAQGATIRFSTDPHDFLPPVWTRYEGVECMNYSPFIYAFAQENIAITGSGTLDGQADSSVWWRWKRLMSDTGWVMPPLEQADRLELFKMAEDGVPADQRVFGEGHYIRPNFIQFYRCRNVLIEGVTIVRSPMWIIHPVLCTNVTVRNIRAISHGPNNDGCNPESCRNVWIEGCYFDTGDDCIAIKSGRNADGRRLHTPCENIVIRGCTMKDGHGGVVIGSEISGGCRNVFIENCIMDSPNLERALRIKTNSLRGGIIENIFMRNVKVTEVSDAVISINFYYEEADAGLFAPIVRHIHINAVTSNKSNYALFLLAYERSPIDHLILTDCRFSNVAHGNVIEHIKNVKVKNVFINEKKWKGPIKTR